MWHEVGFGGGGSRRQDGHKVARQQPSQWYVEDMDVLGEEMCYWKKREEENMIMCWWKGGGLEKRL